MLEFPQFLYRQKTSMKLFQSLKALENHNCLFHLVFQMICYFIHGLSGKGELNHCVITGPPGVGKRL